MHKTETQLIIDELKCIRQKQDEQQLLLQDTADKTNEMYVFYLDGKVGVRLAKYGFGIAMAIGSSFLMIKNVLK